MAQQLRRDGINTELDQFHQEELKHWPRWCEEQLRPENSAFVLCVCTPEYKRRVEGKVAADVGKGVFWEGTLIYTYLSDSKGNQRCVPVLLYEHACEADIPYILAGYTQFKLATFGLEDAQSQYSKLYRLLTRQPARLMIEVGTPQKLPPLPQEARRTNFIPLIQEAIASIKKTESNTEKILVILKDRAVPTSTAQRPHNLPPWMNSDYFIGRGEELQKLMSALTKLGKDAVAQPQVIHGPGGTGKSQLAIQAAWLLYLEEKCDMAFFVSADTPSVLDAKLAELDGESLLKLYQAAEPPKELEIREKKVIEALRAKTGRWVLLLDNVDSKEARDATKRLFSSLAGGRFLVTTQRKDWPRATVQKLELKVFNPTEAVSSLRSRYWKSEATGDDLADFEKLADQVGYLPLGLTLASSYMGNYRITPGRYLADWKQKHQKVLNFVGDDTEVNRSLLTVFKVSYDQLSPAAVVLCHWLAWLAPEPIPRTFVEHSEFLNKAAVSTDISDLLAELQTLSLIELDDESLSVHSLVLICTRAVMSEETRRASLSSALQWLSSTLPKTEYDPEGWRLWVGLSPHLDSAVEASEALQIEGQPLAKICGDYGVWHYFQARFNLAEPLMWRALRIDEKNYGPDHPNVARDLNNLAQLLHAAGRFGKAESLMQRALGIDEKSHGPDHPDVARDLNTLAQLLHAGGRFGEAEPLMRRALEIDEKHYGPQHPDVATDINILGALLQDTDRLPQAEPLYLRALKIDEKS